jgi:hypothetical protein
MKDKEEVQVAWALWQLMTRLSNLIWERYQNEFVQQYPEEEEEKFWDCLADIDQAEGPEF